MPPPTPLFDLPKVERNVDTVPPAGFHLTRADQVHKGDEVLIQNDGPTGPHAVEVTGVWRQTQGMYRPKVHLAPSLGWWPLAARLFVKKAEGETVDHFAGAPLVCDLCRINPIPEGGGPICGHCAREAGR